MHHSPLLNVYEKISSNWGDEMQIIETDVLILGSGAAGLRAAVAASAKGLNVTVLSKGDSANCTRWADKNFEITGGGGCGLAAPIQPPDDPHQYCQDLAQVAGGRNVQELTSILAENSVAAIQYLLGKGAKFVTNQDGSLKVVPEIWHSHPRIIYSKNGTGNEVRRVLKREALGAGVRFIDKVQATKLLRTDTGIGGCLLSHAEAEETMGVRCRAMVLASGGAGGLFLNGSNHRQITGDGVVLAAEAGALTMNMDLYGGIPLGVAPLSGPGFVPHLLLAGKNLTVETVLNNPDFTWQLDHEKLSCETIQHLYPATYEKLRARGFDWHEKSLKFRWVAHFMLGGVAITSEAETSIAGLFAAGEVAGGVTGCGRLPGTGIMEGLVFGEIAGENAARYARHTPFKPAAETLFTDATRPPSDNLSKKQYIRLRQSQQALAGILEKVLLDKKKQHSAEVKYEMERHEKEINSILGQPYDEFSPQSSQTAFFFKLKNTIQYCKLYIEAIRQQEPPGQQLSLFRGIGIDLSRSGVS